MSREALATRLAGWVMWTLVLAPPFLLSPSAKEAFRTPKLLVSEWLGLLSVLLLAWQVRNVEEVSLARLWRLPAVRALLPVLLVATLGLWTSAHPFHVREALADLWIGAACLAGWSLGLSSSRLERLLAGLLWPAAALAVLGILQFHHLFQPLQLLGIGYDPRLAVTSTAGNPGDLAAFLVLPCLVAQRLLLRREPAQTPLARAGTAAALALCLYALVVTQTLAALAAVAVGTLILWLHVLPRRRAAALLAIGAVALLTVVMVVPPLRQRVAEKVDQALHGDFNAVLTGRLDGWYAAGWMLRQHPLAGVGHGAFRPEFVPAKLALLDQGVHFYSGQVLVVFGNAHNEILEAGAEWGWPGLLALAWALWVLIDALRRLSLAAGADRPEAVRDRALAWSGTLALAVLSVAYFPFRVALVAFPALLFLAWVLRRGTPDPAEEPA